MENLFIFCWDIDKALNINVKRIAQKLGSRNLERTQRISLYYWKYVLLDSSCLLIWRSCHKQKKLKNEKVNFWNAIHYSIVLLQKKACSLFEEDNHRVSNIKADVAAIVVCYGVSTFFNHKTMPVSLIFLVELLFNFSSNITEVI